MTKLLSLLTYPLSQSLLLGILALLFMFFHWRRAALCCGILATAWLYLCSTALAANWLMGTLEDDFRPKALSVVQKADAIVVLGGATRGDTHWSSLGDLNQAADRLVYAVQLYRAGRAPMILVSGGAQPGARAEAQLMEEILEVMGVSPRKVLRESESRDTYQNALYSALLLEGKGAKKILLVTSAFHMRRAVPLFQQQGLEVIPAPTDYQRLVADPAVPPWLPSVDDLARTTSALKEYVGYEVYRFRGWL